MLTSFLTVAAPREELATRWPESSTPKVGSLVSHQHPSTLNQLAA